MLLFLFACMIGPKTHLQPNAKVTENPNISLNGEILEEGGKRLFRAKISSENDIKALSTKVTIYTLHNVVLEDLSSTLAFHWKERPQDITNFQSALFNYDQETWVSFKGPYDDVLTLTSLSPYVRNGKLLVRVSLKNKDTGVLEEISLGNKEKRVTGAHLSMEEYKKLPSMEPIKPQASEKPIPMSYSMEQYCAPIGNQGEVGSCTAFAVIDGSVKCQYGLSLKDTPELRSEINVPSVLDFYIQTGFEQSTDICEDGRSITEMMYNQSQSMYRSNQSSSLDTAVNWRKMNITESKCRSRSNALLMNQDLRLGESISFKQIKRLDTDIYEMKYALLYGNPIVIAMPWADTPEETFGVDHTFRYQELPKYFKDGHAMTIVGFSDHKSAFRVRNSWGKHYGDKGYFWLPYSTVEALAKRNLFRSIVFPVESPVSPTETKMTLVMQKDQIHLIHEGEKRPESVQLNGKSYPLNAEGHIIVPQTSAYALLQVSYENKSSHYFLPTLLHTGSAFFYYGKSKVRSVNEEYALILASANQFPEWLKSVDINGHTDIRSDKDFNKKLGKKRSRKVQSGFNQNIETVSISSFGEERATIQTGTIEEMLIDRKVEVVPGWTRSHYSIDKKDYQNLLMEKERILENYKSAHQRLDDWSSLTKEQVVDQLVIYGVKNPNSPSWYNNPSSSDYLPPTHTARELFRKWLEKQ